MMLLILLTAFVLLVVVLSILDTLLHAPHRRRTAPSLSWLSFSLRCWLRCTYMACGLVKIDFSFLILTCEDTVVDRQERRLYISTYKLLILTYFPQQIYIYIYFDVNCTRERRSAKRSYTTLINFK